MTGVSAGNAWRPGAMGPIGPVVGRPGTRPPVPSTPTGKDFASVLRAEVEGIKVSQHAQQRLESRGLSLGDEATARLSGAIGTLARKGGRTSLVLLDDLALVVSVTNRTIITAVPAPEEAVFTNIDSAIRA
jgi:flagellar operon protein